MARKKTAKGGAAKSAESEAGGRAGVQWLALAVVVVLAAGIWLWLVQFRASPSSVAVTMPELSGRTVAGRQAFVDHCSGCHGEQAQGTGLGPPLIHKIYEPSHHGDGSFFLAAQRGVRQHHWDFGDMPPRPDVSESEMADIVAFVRTVQRANGIQ